MDDLQPSMDSPSGNDLPPESGVAPGGEAQETQEQEPQGNLIERFTKQNAAHFETRPASQRETATQDDGDDADNAAEEGQQQETKPVETKPSNQAENFKQLRLTKEALAKENQEYKERYAPYQPIVEKHDAESLTRAVTLESGLFAHLEENGVKQYNDLGQPVLTTRPFLDAISERDPLAVERLALDLAERQHPNGKENMTQWFLKKAGLDPARLPDYLKIDDYIAESTLKLSTDELEAIPEQFREWYKGHYDKLTQDERDQLTLAAPLDQQKLLNRHKGVFETLAKNEANAQAAEKTQAQTLQRWQGETAQKADEAVTDWQKGLNAELLRQITEGVTFNTDGKLNKLYSVNALRTATAAITGDVSDPVTAMEVEALAELGIEPAPEIAQAVEAATEARAMQVRHERAAQWYRMNGDEARARSCESQAKDAARDAAREDLRVKALGAPFVLQVAKTYAGQEVAKAKAKNGKLDAAGRARPDANNGGGGERQAARTRDQLIDNILAQQQQQRGLQVRG